MGARARRESVARGFFADPSPGSESLGAALGNRRPSLVRDFFPTENFERRALRKRSVDKKLLRERSGHGKALRKCSGRFLRVPRSLTGAVMNFLLPRGPRIARGGECAGAPPVAEKTTKHSSPRRCRREQKRSGDGLPRRWTRCAGAKKSKTPPCLGRRTALDAWCIDVGPVGQVLKRPVWSPALEAGHSLHGSVPRTLARRGPGTASENHALQNAAGGKEWTV